MQPNMKFRLVQLIHGTVLPLKPVVKHTLKWLLRSLEGLPKCAMKYATTKRQSKKLVSGFIYMTWTSQVNSSRDIAGVEHGRTVLGRGEWVQYRPLCTVHCALHTVHCTLCTVHCTLHTAHCTVHTVHCALCTVCRDGRQGAASFVWV